MSIASLQYWKKDSYNTIKAISGFLCLLFCFSACAPHRKINRLASKINCDSNFEFTLDPSSKAVRVTYTGEHYGYSEYPNYDITMRASIEDLAKDNPQLKIAYTDALGFPSDSIVKVNVKIVKILWHFKDSSASMEVDLVYELPDRKIHLVGNNKVFVAGTKKGNLFKALKHGNYQFLASYCSDSPAIPF
ncbi:hypothetical protein [Spongiimicrobium salis]|uniref:hypothetical protein n=1 Tax=Spongiimicrobium salis TaxID=1667022 RepID=UPI00374DF30D